ncbi:pilus assembly protein [bacterium AH-315-B06]|nr:pilus assembly protein [bacterium AH-315-B06]
MSIGDRIGFRLLAAKIFGVLSNCRGASAIEFAFVAPVLLFFTIGVMDVGRAVWVSSTLETVAADSARFAMIRGAGSTAPASQSDIEAYAVSLAIAVPAGQLTVDVQWNPNNNPGSSVRIELTHNFESFVTEFFDFGPFQLQGIASRIVL